VFESYFKLIKNPINKQILALEKENRKQQIMIGKMVMDSSETINQLKKEIDIVKQENYRLINERNDLQSKYNNLKKTPKKVVLTNIYPVPKWMKKEVFKRDNYKCLACGTSENLTMDHIKPRSMGGLNDIDNLQTLCQHCNLSKGAKEVDYRNNKIKQLIKVKRAKL